MSASLSAILLSWAVLLGGFEQPATTPSVIEVSEQWMEDHAGHHAVFGWYPGNGHVIYLDVAELGKHSQAYAYSVLVHESTHYLQWLRGDINARSTCEEYLAAEREAYYVQRMYMERYGNSEPVGVNSMRVACGK